MENGLFMVLTQIVRCATGCVSFDLDQSQSPFKGKTVVLLNWPTMFVKRRMSLQKVPKVGSAPMMCSRRANRFHNEHTKTKKGGMISKKIAKINPHKNTISF